MLIWCCPTVCDWGTRVDTPEVGTPSGADPESAYRPGGTPKTLVMIPGASHFAYTDICGNDATLCTDVQQTGGAYLAALARYYVLNDGNMRPYLTGAQMVDGLNLTGLQVQAQGVITQPPRPTVPPKTKP